MRQMIRKHINRTIVLSAAAIAAIVLLLAGSVNLYTNTIRRMEQDNHKNVIYDKHYLLITESDTGIWQTVYESTKAAAEQNNAYLEWLVPDNSQGYTMEDCMQIAISSRVDGIILHPDGTGGLYERISDANLDGIPVVTILNDLNGSDRVSFVGINSYQLGGIFAEQVARLLQPGENEIMILFASSMEEVNQNLMYTQMAGELERSKDEDTSLNVRTLTVDTSSSFEAEETIRDIFIDAEDCPDILVCADAVSTECAYQAMLDYNKVGDVSIVGYYGSDPIKEAIRKELINSVISIDTDEIGKFSVEALEEYRELGYVSDYYNVDLNIIGGGNDA